MDRYCWVWWVSGIVDEWMTEQQVTWMGAWVGITTNG